MPSRTGRTGRISTESRVKRCRWRSTSRPRTSGRLACLLVSTRFRRSLHRALDKVAAPDARELLPVLCISILSVSYIERTWAHFLMRVLGQLTITVVGSRCQLCQMQVFRAVVDENCVDCCCYLSIASPPQASKSTCNASPPFLVTTHTTSTSLLSFTAWCSVQAGTKAKSPGDSWMRRGCSSSCVGASPLKSARIALTGSTAGLMRSTPRPDAA